MIAIWDCLIVGGGPAGLTAATYLGRYRCNVLLIDAGESRMKRIPLTHNVPGFPEGVPGQVLWASMREQAGRYGAHFQEERVDALAFEGRFEAKVGVQTIAARTVLLATGSHLLEPEVQGLNEALAKGLIRYCPICDGFEARDQRIAVLGGRAGAIREAHFLRTYSQDITFLWLPEAEPTLAEREGAVRSGIKLGVSPARQVKIADGVRIVCADGASHAFEIVYPCLGCDPRSELATRLGAVTSPDGGIVVDAHQRTNIPGLYAAGDVLQGLDQIASACGQAAIAATAIHNDLREREAARSDAVESRLHE